MTDDTSNKEKFFEKFRTCTSRELLRSAEILHVYDLLTDTQYGLLVNRIKILYEPE